MDSFLISSCLNSKSHWRKDGFSLYRSLLIWDLRIDSGATQWGWKSNWNSPLYVVGLAKWDEWACEILGYFQIGPRIKANCPIKLVLESEVKSWVNFGGTSKAQRYKRELKEAKTNLIGEQWIRGLQNVKLHWTFTAISLKTRISVELKIFHFAPFCQFHHRHLMVYICYGQWTLPRIHVFSYGQWTLPRIHVFSLWMAIYLPSAFCYL